MLANSYTDRRSDDLLGNATPFDQFVHGRRLQMQASFVPTSTAGITGTLHVVWHETTLDDPNPGYHDVFYASLNVGNCGLPCGQWNDGRVGDSNETAGRKEVDPKAYSIAPDIEVEPDGNKKYVVYMEGDEGSEFDVADVLYNIFFNSTENLTVTSNPSPTPDATDIASNPRVLLPIILKQ